MIIGVFNTAIVVPKNAWENLLRQFGHSYSGIPFTGEDGD